jgi:hypothetical protein
MFPELRAVQIEVPGDALELREASGEAPAHEAGAHYHAPFWTVTRRSELAQV